MDILIKKDINQMVILINDKVAYVVETNVEVSADSIRLINTRENENNLSSDNFYDEIVNWLRKERMDLVDVVITPTNDSYELFRSKLQHHLGEIRSEVKAYIVDFRDGYNEKELKERVFNILHAPSQ